MAEPLGELLDAAEALFAELGIVHVYIGAITLGAHRAPRATIDADVFVFIRRDAIDPLLREAPRHGFIPEPGARGVWFYGGTVRLFHSGLHLDLILAGTPYAREVLRRAQTVPILERSLPIATAEDVILLKLVAHRGQDLVDVERMVIAQGKELDAAHMRRWAQWLASHLRKPEIPSELDRLLAQWGV